MGCNFLTPKILVKFEWGYRHSHLGRQMQVRQVKLGDLIFDLQYISLHLRISAKLLWKPNRNSYTYELYRMVLFR